MKMTKLVLSLSLVFFSLHSNAQDNIAGASAGLESAVANPPQASPIDKIAFRGADPKTNCERTGQNAVNECQNPSGQGFKQALSLAAAVPALAAGFMSGGDPGKMAQMCQMGVLATTLSSLLNSTMGKGCENGSAACQTVCSESLNTVGRQIQTATSSLEVEKLKLLQQSIKETGDKCVADVTAVQQAASSQQGANQQPGGDMASCNAMLDEDGASELVDCTLPEFANAPECTTLAKNDGLPIGFETGSNGLPVDESGGLDVPLGEDREDFWNALKNKTSGGGSAGGGGAGLGGFGGGGSPSSPAGSAAAAARKAGNNMVTGGDSSGGGGGSGFGGGDDDFDRKFSGLDKKKKDLNMLTQKKIGGRNIAGAEFGLSSDDIWTRVYLRTNTRCTKQLAECAANKSSNPYGASSLNKAR